MPSVNVVLVILFVCVKISIEQNGLPPNPCPDIFQYQQTGKEWEGLLNIPSADLGPTVNIEVMLSVAAHLPSQNVGSLNLLRSTEAAVEEIRTHQPIRYKVHFPLQTHLPKLKQIFVNGQILCSGRTEDRFSLETDITLKHSLHTNTAHGNSNPQQSYKPQIIQAPVNIQQQFHKLTTTTKAPNNIYKPNVLVTEPPIYNQKPQQPSYTSQYESETCGTTDKRFQYVPLAIGGKPVPRGGWPWLVAVFINEPTGLTFNCGGSLVSTKVVITAAHCFKTPNRQYAPHEVILYLGRHALQIWDESGSKMAQVEQLIIHNDYSATGNSYDADLAVVIMKEKIQYNEYIRPICLWKGSSNINDVVGTMGTVVGWGRDGTGSRVSSEPKRVNLPIVTQEECLRSSDAYRHITSNRTYCAGARDGTGPCNGDSGSGMSVFRNSKWTLRGVVSVATADLVSGQCNLAEYIVFTDIAKFDSWIRSYLR